MEIAPIIEKHTSGKDLDEQAKARLAIQSILREMRQEGDVVFSSGDLSITGRTGSQWFCSSALIRSTMKYEKEKARAQESKSHSFHVGGDFTGNINTGNVSGNLHQSNRTTLPISSEDEKKLKNWGVAENEIESLKVIVKENGKDKAGLLSKTMKWLGSVTALVAARGFYDNIPALTEFVEKIVS